VVFLIFAGTRAGRPVHCLNTARCARRHWLVKSPMLPANVRLEGARGRSAAEHAVG
jgi:hypothetical protein